MSKIKNGGLDQYGTEPFEQQQCGAAGGEGVNTALTICRRSRTKHNVRCADITGTKTANS